MSGVPTLPANRPRLVSVPIDMSDPGPSNEPADEVDRLLAFLAGRDVPCPRCGYNLRDLSRPQCPECRHDLALAVGVRQPPLAWLLVALAPGAFSLIAATLLLGLMIFVGLIGGGRAPWPIVIADAFGFTSGLAAVVLVRYRSPFLRQMRARQQLWALVIWAVHVMAFVALIVAMHF